MMVVVYYFAPEYPYRCPPAPYERASMIANYLMKNKNLNFHFRLQKFFTKRNFLMNGKKNIMIQLNG